ncbi:hypothetical protein ABZX85_01050 [Streptomyces sp. NPDC004539]|uniref:hypothetical protein n=1 Tax=Streptomyces sp. NPDC004539 TaxID=3154280 RepID=UPI0033A24CBA
MDTELATLAASAANALVGALTTETWERARTLIARLRGTSDTGRLALELAEDRELLLADPANARNRAALTAAWQQRFRTLIADDPDAARAFLGLVAELAETAEPTRPAGPVGSTGPTFHAESHDTSRVYQAAGDMNFGRPPQP